MKDEITKYKLQNTGEMVSGQWGYDVLAWHLFGQQNFAIELDSEKL
jgi:hypothetical protein